MPLRRDPDQFACDLADALFDARLTRLPGNPAEPIELCAGIFRAVTRQHLDVLDRHEQPVIAGIEHLQTIMRRAGDIDRFQPLITSDAVFGVHDEIAGRERCRLGDEIVEASAAARCPRQPIAKNVLFAEQHQGVGREALLERQYCQPDRRARQSGERLAISDRTEIGKTMFAQHSAEPVG